MIKKQKKKIILRENKMKTWMSELPDTTKIVDLFIPGTHDSATSGINIPFVVTQDKNVTEQLNCGIRFLDIRINRVNVQGVEGLVLVHGKVPLLKEFWSDAIDPTKEFLHDNPSEFIFMSIKEGELTENGRVSENDVDSILSNGVYVSSQIKLNQLTVKDCRGKVVFLNRINSKGYKFNSNQTCIGDDYSLNLKFREQVIIPGIQERTQRVCWPIPEPTWTNPFKTRTECKEVVIVPGVQERTQRVPDYVDFKAKTEKVNAFMTSKRSTGKLNICFLSATNASGSTEGALSMVLEPNGVAKNAAIQNSWFCRHTHSFKQDNKGGCILPMDYPDQEVINSIIKMN
ncbi:phosphatidylinositol-specific phospholipase C domain-containing protein [Pelagibaculum spongiae]|uniref:1-phosphatidylinositol phosphodiesterase n=1 Tax=Pelagibaculum spongiae TaxID=2080658 RepID=A0A2V1H4I6_9GAMM|nr:phosphatidylinositol-specific phospholipase C domain-containing protein [Pelagibaculum spongiae]PVZ72138.1 hypothetical protein DC094_03735 [Pelagibaculum spongiae]